MYKGILCFLALASSVNAYTEELKDAFLRDDDLSGTTIDVDVSMNGAGYYVYKYDVSSADTNTGYLSSFIIDLSCSQVVPAGDFNPGDYQTSRTQILTEDIHHVPAAIDAPFGHANPAFSVNSQAFWSLGLKPGESTTDLTIVSPYPPGDRTYFFSPSVDYRWDEYNYEVALKSEERNNVPWIKDWTVTGLTPGPACPGDEYPDDGTGTPSFEGTLVKSDTEENNKLLTYSEPVVDQMTLASDTTEVTVTIFYSEDIDPKTFRVTPANSGWGRLFHPEPGKSETVTVPVRPGKNRIQLSVKSEKDDSNDKDKKKGGAREDKDVFVIRVPDSGNPNASAATRGMK